MTTFATGGYIPGPSAQWRIERLGSCVNGHCLYSINYGAPEHIIPAAEVALGDTSQLDCDGDQP